MKNDFVSVEHLEEKMPVDYKTRQVLISIIPESRKQIVKIGKEY
jgi:hypothetical protein